MLIKKLLSRVLPSPARTFHIKMHEMTEQLNQAKNEILRELKQAKLPPELEKSKPKTPFGLGFYSDNYGPDIDINKFANCKLLPNRFMALEYMPKNAVCAELGVAYGNFSDKILQTMTPKELHLIDLYSKTCDEIEWWGMDLLKKSGLNHHEYILDKFKDYKNVFIKKGYSYKVLAIYPDNYFDYVYVDAGHDYHNVRKDIDVLINKVKNGGIIAFNDYTFFDLRSTIEYGVLRAVNEFLAEGDHEVVFYCLQKQKFDDIIIRISK